MRHAAFLTILLLWSCPAIAQVAPTPEQKKLNRQAYEAMADGDHDAAIDAYLESLDVGELNVTWLNLGRAYQKSGQCTRAFDAFDRVPDAPPVSKPPPDVVNETLTRFTGELEEQCPTRIIGLCNADESTPSSLIIDGEEHPCDEPVVVEAGTHIVTATGELSRHRKSVYVERGTTVEVEFEALPPPADEPATAADTEYDPQPPRDVADAETPPPRDGPRPLPGIPEFDWGGAALVGGGLVVLITGVVFDGVAFRGWPGYAFDYQLTAGDFIPIGIYVGGTVMTVLGIIDLIDGPER